jgi:hypothetical protein
VTIESTTVSDNHGSTGGGSSGNDATGGLYSLGAGPVTLHNSIIAGNTTGSSGTDSEDCEGTVGTSGGNVIGTLGTTGTTCDFTALPSDSVESPALLDSLAFNGATTETHALQALSPALDRGTAPCSTTDQRGVPRPQGLSCDSGAYEVTVPHLLTVTPPVNGTVTGFGIACPGDCSQTYPYGTASSLVAHPASGFLFSGWSGACAGGAACVAHMTLDRTVGATFSVPPPPTAVVPAPVPTPTPTPVPKKKCKKKHKRAAAVAKKCKNKKR